MVVAALESASVVLLPLQQLHNIEGRSAVGNDAVRPADVSPHKAGTTCQSIPFE